MARGKYIEQVFPIQCCGRDTAQKDVFLEPVTVRVCVSQSKGNEKNISLSVECPHNTGGHGQRCKASHPGIDKVGEGVGCIYRLDIP